MDDNKKVVIIGTGFVGMSCAYALLNQNACDELVLIDINEEKAKGEAMDLNHSLAFSPAEMRIYCGKYSDCNDADIIVIAAGVNQKEGESRIDLLKRNKIVFQSIIQPVIDSGFDGIFLIATNPVDIMTRITCVLSGFNPRRVLGTGTSLDTARLRYLVGEYLSVDPRNVHAYVMGEHGDTEFVPWSQALMATKPVTDVIAESCGKYCEGDLDRISENVRLAAQKIIEAKRATYYGIGMALVRITKAIFGNESSILTVSAHLKGEYGRNGVFVGVPCIVGANGIQKVITLKLTDDEMTKLHESCDTLDECFRELDIV